MGSMDSWFVAFTAWDQLGLIVATSNGLPFKDQCIWWVFIGLGGVESMGGGVWGGQMRVDSIDFVCRISHGWGGVDHRNWFMFGGGWCAAVEML